jgi:Flp pilus assembly protein TadG
MNHPSTSRPTKLQPIAIREPSRNPQRGAAAVEFALVLPLFMALLMGTIDYGYFFFSDQIVTNAAREGARAGTLVPPAAGADAAKAAAVAAAADYLTRNRLSCPGGGTGCITPTSPTITDVSISTPAIDVVISFPAVSITGFTQAVRILPANVRGHSIMRWQ